MSAELKLQVDTEAVKALISPESINALVANAILESALGEKIRKVLQSEVDELSASYDDTLRKAVETIVQQQLWTILREEFSDQLRAAIREKISAETVKDLTDAAWLAFESKLYKH